MQFVCFCGAEVDSTQRPAACPACGRTGCFDHKTTSPHFPRSFTSPVLSADQLRITGAKLKPLPGVWTRLSPRWGFPFMGCIYGEPGVGKSTLAMKLADDWPGTAVYLSMEEGLGSTLADRAARLEIRHCRFAFPGDWQELVDQVREASLVVVDSVQRLWVSPESLRGELVDRGRKNVLAISQVNTSGDVRGGRAISHVADLSVRLPSYGLFEVVKSRFGELGGGSWLEQ